MALRRGRGSELRRAQPQRAALAAAAPRERSPRFGERSTVLGRTDQFSRRRLTVAEGTDRSGFRRSTVETGTARFDLSRPRSSSSPRPPSDGSTSRRSSPIAPPRLSHRVRERRRGSPLLHDALEGHRAVHRKQGAETLFGASMSPRPAWTVASTSSAVGLRAPWQISLLAGDARSPRGRAERSSAEPALPSAEHVNPATALTRPRRRNWYPAKPQYHAARALPSPRARRTAQPPRG